MKISTGWKQISPDANDNLLSHLLYECLFTKELYQVLCVKSYHFMNVLPNM